MKRKIIENYALNEVLGEGMYGTVFKATHMQSNDEFAVKVVPITKFQENPKLQQCTVNQIKILQTIEKSTFIIKYIQMLKTPNNFYFVYEFCNGGTLEHKLKQQNKLPEKDALKIFKQLVEAFKVLNKYNIMHRDLKPDNIFFHNENLKLGDFGFCKTLGNPNEMASTMLGSPIYMAPEVLKGEAYTSKADIWSLGVVLYEMLFGACPFQSNSIAKLITVLADTQLKLPEDVLVSNATQTLLKKLLVKDQSKRIDWFQLLNYNISQDGVITQPQKFSSLQELKTTSSERSINDYNKKYSIQQPPSPAGNLNSELTFKKKLESGVKTNTFTYGSNGNSSPKKAYTQQVSNSYSTNLSKRSSDLDDSKRRYLLDQHVSCINAIKTAVGFLKFGDTSGLVFAIVLFKKVEERLRKICQSIDYSETDIADINSTLSNQLRLVQRQSSQVIREAKNANIDFSLTDAPKNLLRQKYVNKDDVNAKLWYELISFLNENKLNPRASPQDWEHTIEVFIN